MNQKGKLEKINKDIEDTENRLRRAEQEEKILKHQHLTEKKEHIGFAQEELCLKAICRNRKF